MLKIINSYELVVENFRLKKLKKKLNANSRDASPCRISLRNF